MSNVIQSGAGHKIVTADSVHRPCPKGC